MSANRKYLTWLAVTVVVVVVATLLLVPRGTWVAMDVRRSSLRTTPDGVAAWSRALGRLGVSVSPRYTSVTQDPPRGGGLVLLEPVQPPSAAEVGEILSWMRNGGLLVYSPNFTSLILDSLGVSLSRRSLGLVGSGSPGVSRLLDNRWTKDVEADTLLATWTLEPDSLKAVDWTPLAVLRDSAATLAWVHEGAGGALIVAEAATLSNSRLASSALATVATRAVVDLLGAGDTLFFSEYHQAYDGRRGILRESYSMATSSPVGRLLLYAAAVSVALLVLSGRAFGAPVPEPESDRRSPLEHVEALGRIYEGAASDRAVARRLVHGAVRRFGQRPPGAETEKEILEAWAGRPELASPTRLAIAAFEREPPDLVKLSSALDDIVHEYTTKPPTP